MTGEEVRLMERLYSDQMAPEWRDHCRWEDGDPILAALAPPHPDLPQFQIEILDPRCHGLRQPQTAAAEEKSNQLRMSLHLVEHDTRFTLSEDHKETHRRTQAT